MSAAQDEYNELFRDKTRRSHHPADDNDDAASFLDDDSDDDTNVSTPNASQSNLSSFQNGDRPRYLIPSERQHSNTGPKGVIADAQAYRDAAREHRTSTSASRKSFQQNSRSYDAGLVNGKSSAVALDGVTEDFDEEDVENMEPDDAFMDQWRRNRLKDLQGNGMMVGQSGKERRAAQARYGGLIPVDGEGFLEAVDGSGSVTVVVVFIYDDLSEVSQMVEDCITPLARKYINTRFVKLHFEDAEMEPAGVPAVLAYRGGDKFAGLVPLVDEIPDDADLSPSTLEKLFQRHQIL